MPEVRKIGPATVNEPDDLRQGEMIFCYSSNGREVVGGIDRFRSSNGNPDLF